MRVLLPSPLPAWDAAQDFEHVYDALEHLEENASELGVEAELEDGAFPIDMLNFWYVRSIASARVHPYHPYLLGLPQR